MNSLLSTEAPDMTEFRKGDRVEYELPTRSKIWVEAIIRTAHRDGTLTVEAQRYRGGTTYLGFIYRRLPAALFQRRA